MATLIGAGAHTQDILSADRTFDGGRFVVHHDYIDMPFDLTVYTRPIVIGVNDPRLRAKIAAELGIYDDPWIHLDAHLYHSVWYGDGTHINYGVHAVRTRIGNHCTISPGVTICGDVTIGDRVLVGAGAVICDRVTIGNDVTIGAGTIILPETRVLDGETWVGNPGRRIER